MIALLIRLEWRHLLADRACLAAAALLGASILYAAANGVQWVRFQQKTLEGALTEERDRLREIRATIPLLASGAKKVSPFLDPRSPAVVGRSAGARYATLPPAPLAALAIGQSDLYPSYFKVTTGSKQTFLQNDEIENPLHLLAGRFDLAFVILYLLPLVILALSYNVVSAEAESGTLALSLSQPVSLRTLVLSKVFVRAVFLITLTALFSLVGLLLGGVRIASGAVLAALLLWNAAVGLYAAFWFALAVGVNARGKSSATNAMLLAGAWLVLVVVLPSLLNAGIKALYPVPSRVQLIQAMRTASDDASRQGSALLARFLEDHPELAPPGASPAQSDFNMLSIAVNERVEQQTGPVLALFERQLAQQQMLAGQLRFLSPVLVAQSAFYGLAGSGQDRYQHFLRQADSFHRSWREYFVPRILSKTTITPDDVDRFPQFRFVEEPFSAVVARVLVPIGGLAILSCLLAAAAWRALGRYPITQNGS